MMTYKFIWFQLIPCACSQVHMISYDFTLFFYWFQMISCDFVIVWFRKMLLDFILFIMILCDVICFLNMSYNFLVALISYHILLYIFNGSEWVRMMLLMIFYDFTWFCMSTQDVAVFRMVGNDFVWLDFNYSCWLSLFHMTC